MKQLYNVQKIIYIFFPFLLNIYTAIQNAGTAYFFSSEATPAPQWNSTSPWTSPSLWHRPFCSFLSPPHGYQPPRRRQDCPPSLSRQAWHSPRRGEADSVAGESHICRRRTWRARSWRRRLGRPYRAAGGGAWGGWAGARNRAGRALTRGRGEPLLRRGRRKSRRSRIWNTWGRVARDRRPWLGMRTPPSDHRERRPWPLASSWFGCKSNFPCRRRRRKEREGEWVKFVRVEVEVAICFQLLIGDTVLRCIPLFIGLPLFGRASQPSIQLFQLFSSL